MACTLSEAAELKLIDAGAANETSRTDTDVILIGCGGSRVKPKCTIELNMEIYGCSISVPALVVRGQSDDLIIGTNVIKHILHRLKRDSQYWKVISAPTSNCQESEQFLSLLAGLNRWTSGDVPDKVGTAKCNTAVTVDAGTEYLLWAKLPGKAVVSPGSTVIVEPTSSHAAPRGLMIARIVTPLWGDRWIPLKVLNASSRPITIRRNAKFADVFTCLALEDMGGSEGPLCSKVQITDSGQTVSKGSDISRSHENSRIEVKEALKLVGLSDLDLEACDVSETWKEKLADLVLKYEDIFSHHHLDCGEAKGFVHRIHLVDDKPFRLPFRRVPPAEYQKLKRVLDEMEEREIIRKSTSEYASPLVLVWKKDGDLRVCTDFRWLNKRTLKDAHPLPHQADCLAALGGNALFSTMDLTSGFYNMPLHEDDRKYSAFTTPMGLYEYNRLPQGLCNSPGSFMRMMTSIFGDQNFLSLLCYLDDLLVYAPTEALALERLELVFSRLRLHNLKLAPKKCWFLRRSVKFLGHVVDESGVSTDPSKVDAISQMCTNDLMELDGVTPSPSRIRSFLGMINFYQHFIPNYSATAKPLFGLVAGQKQKRKGRPHAKTLLKMVWARCSRKFRRVKVEPDPLLLQASRSHKLKRGILHIALKWAVCDKFSHWLKGHVFTVWTDNNPLTHIMTKPKLDSCEQRWVAKLASFEFDIKYIPGPRNIVADALSRKPFVRPIIGQRILKVPYDELLRQTVPVSTNSVQDAFRCSGCPGDDVTCLVGEKEWTPTCTENHSLSREVVSAVLETHSVWDSGARARATGLLHHLPQMISSDADIIPYSERELREAQLTDPVLSRVLHYVDRGRRPSRREKAREPVMVLRYLKQWEKLGSTIDLMFKNILKDPEVSSYDSYVVSLTKDLKDAMVIAQQHADKEQHRQEQNYNRRVKGSQITVGDRVLVANKRERGKRKTADRWESTVYTVVSVNGSTHTYRIRSPVTGQERVVHHNLLMLVNFLPLDLEAASDASFAASQSASSHDVSDVDGCLPVSDIADDARTRVQDWVSGLPCSEVNVASTESVEAVSTVRSSVPCPTHREQSGNVDQSSDDTRSESATSGNLVHVHANDCPTSTVNLSSIHDVRSRVGRLVKPVDRLIYTMSKQVTDRNSYKTINKVAREHMYRQLCCLCWLLDSLTLEHSGRIGPVVSCWDAKDPGRSRNTLKTLNKEKTIQAKWEQFVSPPKSLRPVLKVSRVCSARSLTQKSSSLSVPLSVTMTSSLGSSLSSLALDAKDPSDVIVSTDGECQSAEVSEADPPVSEYGASECSEDVCRGVRLLAAWQN
ncbi:hypothetical protein SRHO_G00266190 [Serrasalmus rhombeus]